MNPFLVNVFDTFKNLIRTALWLALAVNAAAIAIFSIVFITHFCYFAWKWLLLKMFSEPWGVT